MMHLLALLLPCLIPSWRFFKSIEPSPRVEWRVFARTGPPLTDWQEYRPRPVQVPVAAMLLRLFWNPGRNRELYMISLSERLMLAPSDHSLKEIRRLVSADVGQKFGNDATEIAFRMIFVSREDTQIVTQITYASDPFPRVAGPP